MLAIRWALQLALLFGLASGAIVLVDTCDRCVCSDKCLFKDAVTTAKNYRERKSTYCHVNCKSKLLTAFPINMPRNVEVLDLSNNQFQELPIGAFAQLAALRHLDLSNNFLKQASFSTVSAAYPRGRGLFDHNERLETLILVNNRIASFAPSAAWVAPFKRATRQKKFTAAVAATPNLNPTVAEAPAAASVCTCAAIVRIRPRGPTAGDEELDFEEFLQIFLSQLAKIKCAHSDTVYTITMTLPSSARAL